MPKLIRVSSALGVRPGLILSCFGVGETRITMWHGPWLATLPMDMPDTLRETVGVSASPSMVGKNGLLPSMLKGNRKHVSWSTILRDDVLTSEELSASSGMWNVTRDRGVGVWVAARGVNPCLRNMLAGSGCTAEAIFGFFGVISDGGARRTLCFSLANVVLRPVDKLCTKTADALNSLVWAMEDWVHLVLFPRCLE